MMYKTIRHGDASLQYTILPQIDQFYVNEISPIITGSSSSKNSSTNQYINDKNFRLCDNFGVKSAQSFYLGLRIIALFLFCGIGIYLIENMSSKICDVNPCVNESSSFVKNQIFTTENNIVNDYEIPDNFTDSSSTVTTTSEDLNFSKIFPDYRAYVDKIKTSNSVTTRRENESRDIDFKIDEKTLSTTRETPTTEFSSNQIDVLPSTNSASIIDPASKISENSTKIRTSVTSSTTERIVDIMKKLKILKMPRITLKLRTNETVPRMYVKSGIASYKKGKITTSVLAQGLSLEGLVFKTPEGTIKPWREKWPFDENSEVFQPKHRGIVWRDLMFAILIVLTAVTVLTALRLFTASRRLWHSIEQIDVEIHDDSDSNLLDVQCQEPIDKE